MYNVHTIPYATLNVCVFEALHVVIGTSVRQASNCLPACQVRRRFFERSNIKTEDLEDS